MAENKINTNISDNPRTTLSTKQARNIISENTVHFQSGGDFSRLDAEKKEDKIMRSLVNYFGVPQRVGEADFSKMERWTSYAEGVVDLIKLDYCNDLSELLSYTIDDRGVLELVYKDGKKDHITLLLDSLTLGQEATTRQLAHEQSRISREAIRSRYETEAYLGGEILVVYERIGDTLKSGTEQVGATALGAYYVGRSVKPSIMRMRSITYRLANGSTRTARLDSTPENVGTKEQLEKTVTSKLERQGILPDRLKGGFAPRAIAMMHKTQLDMMRMSYRDFVTQFGEDIVHRVSKNDFEMARQQLIGDLEKFNNDTEKTRKTTQEITKMFQKEFITKWTDLRDKFSIESISKNKGAIAKGTLTLPIHVMMLGLFATRFQENSQDSLMLAAAGGEAIAFEAGAFIGNGIADKVFLGRGKFALGMAFGIWGVSRAEKLAHAIKLDKEMWKRYPDREDGDFKDGQGDAKSFVDHALSLGTVNDIIDSPTIPLTNIKKPRGDIRIPGVKGGMDIRGVDLQWQKIPVGPLGLAVPYPSRVGPDAYTTVPDIALWKHEINFGTDARTYMLTGVERDARFWNDRVSEFQTWIIPQIRELLSQFEKKTGIFVDANVLAASKNRNDPEGISMEELRLALLRERLRTLFGSPLVGMFAVFNSTQSQEGMGRGNDLAEYISEVYRKNMSSDERDKRIAWWTIQQTEALKITPSKVNFWKKEIAEKSQEILGEGSQLAENITDPKKKIYFLSLFERIRSRKKMVDQSDEDKEIIQAQKEGRILEVRPIGVWIEEVTPLDRNPEILKARKEGKILEERKSGVWIESEVLGTKSKKWIGTKSKKFIQYQEYTWFSEFLDDTSRNKNADSHMLWVPNFGDMFYDYLTKMIDFKRQEQFVKNLEQHGAGTRWRIGKTVY